MLRSFLLNKKFILIIFYIFYTNILFTEEIGHECGFAFVYLRKPLSYYRTKYDDHAWALKKLCLLLEKQRHRGQDGAGIASFKLNMPPGKKYFMRVRSAENNALDNIINIVLKDLNFKNKSELDILNDLELKQNYEFIGEAYLGHVRYGTYSKLGNSFCQPFLCKNNIVSKSFAFAGNFNMTNSKDILKQLTSQNINPTSTSDTELILQQISFYLEQEHVKAISQKINLEHVIENAAQHWDGGYVFASILGNGDAFVCRDPAGIRPGFFYYDEEVVAAASERSALSATFNVEPSNINPIKPGHTLIIKKSGEVYEKQFISTLETRQCSFERIYFSRCTDPEIYQERKALGSNLANRVLNILNYDLENVVFTFIPNTSEVAFRGLIEEIQYLHKHVKTEMLVHKNQRLRTFIANDQSRFNLVTSLYDVTKGIIKPIDTLVAIDDSIVRGTTLRESILKKLIELNPKRIIIISSAPPILYPDCYGIDMSQIDKFVAFNAAISVLKEQNKEYIIQEVKKQCKLQKNNEHMTNYVKRIYENISFEQLEKKIAELVKPTDINWQGELSIIYQTIEGLHKAIPNHTGDWYFTGNYPTPGGYKVLNQSFLNWCQGIQERAY